MISEAALAQMKAKLDASPLASYAAFYKSEIVALLREVEELRAALRGSRIQALEEAAEICDACCHEFPACGVALAAINRVINQARAALGEKP